MKKTDRSLGGVKEIGSSSRDAELNPEYFGLLKDFARGVLLFLIRAESDPWHVTLTGRTFHNNGGHWSALT